MDFKARVTMTTYEQPHYDNAAVVALKAMTEAGGSEAEKLHAVHAQVFALLHLAQTIQDAARLIADELATASSANGHIYEDFKREFDDHLDTLIDATRAKGR